MAPLKRPTNLLTMRVVKSHVPPRSIVVLRNGNVYAVPYMGPLGACTFRVGSSLVSS